MLLWGLYRKCGQRRATQGQPGGAADRSRLGAQKWHLAPRPGWGHRQALLWDGPLQTPRGGGGSPDV